MLGVSGVGRVLAVEAEREEPVGLEVAGIEIGRGVRDESRSLLTSVIDRLDGPAGGPGVVTEKES